MLSTHRRERSLSAKRRALHRVILRWYHRHGRDLPWRRTRDAWHILVSEVMLQQTQVSRVAERYPEWLTRFPTTASHAAATTREALLAWSGMGYNRRAMHLHAAARYIMERHGGRVPREMAVLRTLPGIGVNTAHAVLCFAFAERLPVIDINVRRVISRMSERLADPSSILSERVLHPLAESLLPPRAYYNWNQAMMDLGATICTSRSPRCDACPARRHCASAFAFEGCGEPRPKQRGHDDVPRRIHRGRVIEFLRQRTGSHSASFTEAGRVLRASFAARDHGWLTDILASLERDRMIEVTVNGRPATFLGVNRLNVARLRISLPR